MPIKIWIILWKKNAAIIGNTVLTCFKPWTTIRVRVTLNDVLVLNVLGCLYCCIYSRMNQHTPIQGDAGRKRRFPSFDQIHHRATNNLAGLVRNQNCDQPLSRPSSNLRSGNIWQRFSRMLRVVIDRYQGEPIPIPTDTFGLNRYRYRYRYRYQWTKIFLRL